MESRGVDPRDQTWELSDPIYRVYFHDHNGSSDEHEIQAADGITEVLAWAEATRGERTFVVYACVPKDGLGLVRLHGRDPNEG